MDGINYIGRDAYTMGHNLGPNKISENRLPLDLEILPPLIPKVTLLSFELTGSLRNPIGKPTCIDF